MPYIKRSGSTTTVSECFPPISIIGADTDNTESPPVKGRPTIQVYRGADHASAIKLPVMKAPATTASVR